MASELPSLSDITKACLDPNNQMVKCDSLNGYFMTMYLLFRGDVSHKDVNKACNDFRRSGIVSSENWYPATFKAGMTYHYPSTLPKSPLANIAKDVCMLTNNTAIGGAFTRLHQKFDLLYSKKAYLHWYLREGMEEEEFIEKRELRMGESDGDEESVDHYFLIKRMLVTSNKCK